MFCIVVEVILYIKNSILYVYEREGWIKFWFVIGFWEGKIMLVNIDVSLFYWKVKFMVFVIILFSLIFVIFFFIKKI